MLAETQDEEQIIARVAAIDIGKAELVCCVRVPAPGNPKKRWQEVSTHSTMSRSLAELANHLVELRSERVVMEATSDYWRPVFYLLEAHGLEPWLVSARDVKHLPPIVAIGRSILVITWHLLQNPDALFRDPGADHFSRHTDPESKRKRPHPTARSTRLHRDPSHQQRDTHPHPYTDQPPGHDGHSNAQRPRPHHLH
ncbi:hypothetical protein [Arthrobacter sp. NPDC056493]|uniref:hypothetical protein n=1 Tax=Arthrobacter sp. NPDC056493 TaxID=3345839 RepID=UPI00366C53A5